MKKTDKIGFEDIFDLMDIEKIFEQTLEGDILKLMDEWHKKIKKRNNKQSQTHFTKTSKTYTLRK